MSVTKALLFFSYITIILALAEDFQCPKHCKCIAATHTVDCSGRGLPDIPNGIPNTTVLLKLDRNKLRILNSKSVEHLKELQGLTVAKNAYLKLVEKGFFQEMLKLQLLDISKTSLSISEIQNHVICGLNSTTIKRIVIQDIRPKLTYLPDNFFACFLDKHIEELNLEFNAIHNLSQKVLYGLENVKSLNLNQNRLQYLYPETMKYIPRLEYLYISNNDFQTMPDFCSHLLVLHNLKKIDISHNAITRITDLSCLKKLQTLELNNNLFKHLNRNTFKSISQTVTQLSLARTQLHSVQPGSFNSTVLQILDLCGNNLKIDSRFADILLYTPNLTTFRISENTIKYNFYRDFFFVLLKPVPKLESLEMGNLDLHTIPNQAFCNLQKLKIIILENNYLTQISPGIFCGIQNLQILSVRQNNINIFRETDLPESIWKSLKQLSLYGNPWACDCRLRWFQKFLTTTNITIPMLHHLGYKCFSPPHLKNTNLLQFHPTFQECNRAITDKILQSMFAIQGFVMLASTLLSFLYRYRWDIRYYTYIAFMKKRSQQIAQDNDVYEYDIFISYHHNEYIFIRDILVPKLENEFNFKCCVHDRDWLLGNDIFNNIATSINRSRKTMFIVSNAFVTSHWCQTELSIAQTYFLENDKNNIILVIFEDLLQFNLTPRLVYQMKTTTYIEWTKNERGQDLFWEKMKRAISEPGRSVIYAE